MPIQRIGVLRMLPAAASSGGSSTERTSRIMAMSAPRVARFVWNCLPHSRHGQVGASTDRRRSRFGTAISRPGTAVCPCDREHRSSPRNRRSRPNDGAGAPVGDAGVAERAPQNVRAQPGSCPNFCAIYAHHLDRTASRTCATVVSISSTALSTALVGDRKSSTQRATRSPVAASSAAAYAASCGR